MTIYEKIKHYYEIDIYTKRHLKAFLNAGILSYKEYDEIVKEESDT